MVSPRRGPTIVNAVVYDRVIERAEKVYPLEGRVLALVADNPVQKRAVDKSSD